MPRRPEDSTRVNERITSPEIRVIDQDGEMLGVMTPRDAIDQAANIGLDLVEISPNAKPPVCKMLDYSKHKYEQQKKAAEARKNQKTVDVKEIKVRPAIGEHDYQVKYKNARKFLDNGDKVKVTLRLRGREMAHKDLAMEVLHRLKDELSDISKVDLHPKFEGRQVVMVLSAEKAET